MTNLIGTSSIGYVPPCPPQPLRNRPQGHMRNRRVYYVEPSKGKEPSKGSFSALKNLMIRIAILFFEKTSRKTSRNPTPVDSDD